MRAIRSPGAKRTGAHASQKDFTAERFGDEQARLSFSPVLGDVVQSPGSGSRGVRKSPHGGIHHQDRQRDVRALSQESLGKEERAARAKEENAVTNLGNALQRAYALASKHGKVWHVVEYANGEASPVGEGHYYDGEARSELLLAAARRDLAAHAAPYAWQRMHAVFPDGSTLNVSRAELRGESPGKEHWA